MRAGKRGGGAAARPVHCVRELVNHGFPRISVFNRDRDGWNSIGRERKRVVLEPSHEADQPDASVLTASEQRYDTRQLDVRIYSK